MIFLCGIPSEPSLGMVIEQLERLGAPHVVFNQRRFSDLRFELELSGNQLTGRMTIDGRAYRLEAFKAIYTRLMDYRSLPEIETQPADAPARSYCRNLHAVLAQWCELAPGKVLNRSHEFGLSHSKPLQAQVIRRCGFSIPETLVTNDPRVVLDFYRQHGEIIYKSISRVRSIVRLLNTSDLERLDAVRTCPVQFQAFIQGTNVRVHTVGGHVFPTAIKTSAVDHRYGEDKKLEPIELSDDVAQRCLRLAAAYNLEFAGIDLMITPVGQVFCLEVNQSPAFRYYEQHTGQPIARAVADYLAASC